MKERHWAIVAVCVLGLWGILLGFATQVFTIFSMGFSFKIVFQILLNILLFTSLIMILNLKKMGVFAYGALFLINQMTFFAFNEWSIISVIFPVFALIVFKSKMSYFD